MTRMIDLIRASAVPSNLMQAAARGALSIPPREMIEILVYLASHNLFGEQARFTLAGWEETSSKAIASDPKAPKEVLEYLVAPENLRPVLLPLLLNNPSVTEENLVRLAAAASRETIDVLLQNERVSMSHPVLDALHANQNLSGSQSRIVAEKLAVAATPVVAPSGGPNGEGGQSTPIPAETAAATPEPVETAELQPAAEPAEMNHEADEAVDAFMTRHAEEISAEGDKPFLAIGGSVEESDAESPPVPAPAAPAAPPETPSSETTPHRSHVVKKSHLSHEDERGSALQKISKLDVKGRIQLAMKGTKEERSILIRDGTKLVALAVLESPKVTDGEVEKFAGQKNVLEAVLRAIPMKRRFAKNYIVVRNLVFNPRTPIDLSLGLMKNILVNDLRHLSANKEVPDTVRKLALKMFKQKTDVTKRSS